MDYLLVLAIAAALGWVVYAYNRLVRDRNRVAAAWSDIDVQLKRRHDLIPKLVDAVKQYAAYEKATLTAVTELRARSTGLGDVSARGEAEGALGRGMLRLLALAERYPELEADDSFLSLQADISGTEEHIQLARRYYNGAVRALNTRIDSFPDSLVASAFGFRAAAFFELEDPAERHSPELS